MSFQSWIHLYKSLGCESGFFLNRLNSIVKHFTRKAFVFRLFNIGNIRGITYFLIKAFVSRCIYLLIKLIFKSIVYQSWFIKWRIQSSFFFIYYLIYLINFIKWRLIFFNNYISFVLSKRQILSKNWNLW